MEWNTGEEDICAKRKFSGAAAFISLKLQQQLHCYCVFSLEKNTNRYLNEWILQNTKEMYQTSTSAVLNKVLGVSTRLEKAHLQSARDE